MNDLIFLVWINLYLAISKTSKIVTEEIFQNCTFLNQWAKFQGNRLVNLFSTYLLISSLHWSKMSWKSFSHQWKPSKVNYTFSRLYMVDSIQDLNFRWNIQTKLQLWCGGTVDWPFIFCVCYRLGWENFYYIEACQ